MNHNLLEQSPELYFISRWIFPQFPNPNTQMPGLRPQPSSPIHCIFCTLVTNKTHPRMQTLLLNSSLPSLTTYATWPLEYIIEISISHPVCSKPNLIFIQEQILFILSTVFPSHFIAAPYFQWLRSKTIESPLITVFFLTEIPFISKSCSTFKLSLCNNISSPPLRPWWPNPTPSI